MRTGRGAGEGFRLPGLFRVRWSCAVGSEVSWTLGPKAFHFGNLLYTWFLRCLRLFTWISGCGDSECKSLVKSLDTRNWQVNQVLVLIYCASNIGAQVGLGYWWIRGVQEYPKIFFRQRFLSKFVASSSMQNL